MGDALLIRRNSLHGQADAVTLLIHIQHHNLHNIANFNGFTGMLESTVGYLRNVHQTIMVNTNVHEGASAALLFNMKCSPFGYSAMSDPREFTVINVTEKSAVAK